MKDVKVTELRQNLLAYLARVRKGERLRVTSRGKVIAEIAPALGVGIRAARERLRGSVAPTAPPTSSTRRVTSTGDRPRYPRADLVGDGSDRLARAARASAPCVAARSQLRQSACSRSPPRCGAAG
jgi:prevent-host-death family protein